MKKTITVPNSFKEKITEQAGMFTRQQALDAGLTRSVMERFAREERWFPISHGLWSLRPDLDWQAKLWGGYLLGGTGAVIGGQAAAHLWGAAAQPAVVEVWCPSSRRHGGSGHWRFRRGLRPRDGEVQPPRTSLADAVLEMCVGASTDDVVGHVSRAVKSTNTTTALIREALASTRRHPNRLLLQDITHDYHSGSESPLERRFLHDVVRAHGLPEGTLQASVARWGFTDVGYAEYGVLVELDGRSHHQGLAAHSDMARDNSNLLNGNRTFRYGLAALVARPCKVAGEIGVALRQGGWPGQRLQCPRCRGRRKK